MDRREPPSLRISRPARAADGGDAPPRLRPLRGDATSDRQATIWSRLGALVLGAAVLVVCVVAAGATFIMVAAPTDLVRDQIVAQVKARTGRTLMLAGPASVTVFPSVGVQLADVTLSAPPGMQAAPLVRMRRLVAEVRLMPLLRREVVIRRLVLSEPAFELTVDAAGRRSWDFAAADDGSPAAPPIRLAQAGLRGTHSDGLPPELKDFVRNSSDPAMVGKVAGGSLAGLGDLMLADTRIENGTLRYTDLRSGTRHELRAIHAVVGLKALSSPLEAKGRLDWQGETLQVEARLQTLKSMLDGRPAKLTANVSGRPVEITYDGTLTQRSAVELDGKVSATSPSVRALAGWLGSELPPAPGFGPGSLAGNLKAAGGTLALDTAVLTLDGATANGTITVDTGGPRPLLKANLRISELNLGKYRDSGAAGTADRSAPRRIAQPLPATAAGKDRPVESIEDLLRRDGVPGPQVRGFSQRDGWSSAPLDLAALAVVDADAKLAIDKLTAGELRLGTTQLLIALKAQVLRLTIEDAQLYEGRAKGFITLDATRSAALGANLQVQGVSAQSLLRDGAGFDSLAGTGRLSLAVAGQGKSEKEIVDSLTGRADVTVTDGAIVGWNIPQMLRGLGQGRFSGFDRVASEKTDFSELAASFQIAAGIATNKDLRLIGPLLRVTGAGTVELPARRIDYTVRPKLVASLAGQGSAQDQAGFEIPVKIQGPWDRPSYAPDLQAALRDSDQAIDAVKKLGKKLDSNGMLGDIVRRALGGGQQNGGETVKPSQLLEQLLKR